MGMSYSEIWKTNNFDRIAEMAMDEATMSFNEKDFDRVESELFEEEYNKTKKMFYEALGRLKELENSLRLAYEALEEGANLKTVEKELAPVVWYAKLAIKHRQAIKQLEEKHEFLRSQKMKDKERKEGAE